MLESKFILQAQLKELLRKYRREQQLTQEQFASVLCISARSYRSLEHGTNCASAATLICFLNLLDNDAMLQTVHALAASLGKSEDKGGAEP